MFSISEQCPIPEVGFDKFAGPSYSFQSTILAQCLPSLLTCLIITNHCLLALKVGSPLGKLLRLLFLMNSKVLELMEPCYKMLILHGVKYQGLTICQKYGSSFDIAGGVSLPVTLLFENTCGIWRSIYAICICHMKWCVYSRSFLISNLYDFMLLIFTFPGSWVTTGCGLTLSRGTWLFEGHTDCQKPKDWCYKGPFLNFTLYNSNINVIAALCCVAISRCPM